MSIYKKIYNNLIGAFPKSIQKSIHDIVFYMRTPKLIDARYQYKYSDEHLKFVHIMESINYLRVAGDDGRVLPQTYFEFGIHSGRTFSTAINASNLFGMKNMQFFAFDSFEGLPVTNKEEDGCFQAGTFCTSRSEFVGIVEKRTGVLLDDTSLVQGFYCDSLTDELQSNMPKAGVVHIDVDLYSSTVDVLHFLSPLFVPGTVLIFDDWYCFPGGSLQGERRALTEFIDNNHGVEVEPWKAYSTFGQSFFVTKVPHNNMKSS